MWYTPRLLRGRADWVCRVGSMGLAAPPLAGMEVCALHPASWFCVAWYPVYRISEGPLRTAFLTYHVVGQREGAVLPAVGMQCYHSGASREKWLCTRAEEWRGGQTPGQLQRLACLEAGAATLVQGVGSSRQSDHEFFKRRRQ